MRKNPLCEEVEERLGLFVSDDLSREESDVVTRHLKYCPSCAKEFDAWTNVYESLHDASIMPLPVDNISVWNCIEPRLGPAGRTVPKPTWAVRWISTKQLTLAFMILLMVTVYRETPKSQIGTAMDRGPGVVAIDGNLVDSISRGDTKNQVVRHRNSANSTPVYAQNMWPRSIGGLPVSVATSSPALDPHVPFAGLGLILGRLSETSMRTGERNSSTSARRPVVVRVVAGSIAQKAGFQKGDVISCVGNEPVESISRFVETLEAISVMNRIEIGIIRDGELQTITFALNSDEHGHGWIRVLVQPMPCRDSFNPPTTRSIFEMDRRNGTLGTDDPLQNQ